MELRDIECFAAIAGHGHVGRAADALDMSQSALSKSLRRIETAIGAKVVERTPKGIRLTATGSALLAHVRRLQLARDDVVRELADLGRGASGHLRVGATPGFMEELVALACGQLFRETPQITLKIDLVNIDATFPGLVSGIYDLTVGAHTQGRWEGLTHEPLTDDEFVVYASANHRLARRKRITLGDLADEKWIKTAPAGYYSYMLQRLFEEAGLAPPQMVLETNSTAIRLQSAASSDLLYFNSRRFMDTVKRPYNLVRLPLKELRWVRHNSVSYRGATYLSPLARRFIAAVKKAAGNLPRES